MTPQQLIDLCRATSQPLPSGRKIAEVVEKLVEERNKMAKAVVQHAFPHELYVGVGCCICKAANGATGGQPLYHSGWCPVPLAERILKEAS